MLTLIGPASSFPPPNLSWGFFRNNWKKRNHDMFVKTSCSSGVTESRSQGGPHNVISKNKYTITWEHH